MCGHKVLVYLVKNFVTTEHTALKVVEMLKGKMGFTNLLRLK